MYVLCTIFTSCFGFTYLQIVYFIISSDLNVRNITITLLFCEFKTLVESQFDIQVVLVQGHDELWTSSDRQFKQRRILICCRAANHSVLCGHVFEINNASEVALLRRWFTVNEDKRRWSVGRKRQRKMFYLFLSLSYNCRGLDKLSKDVSTF